MTTRRWMKSVLKAAEKTTTVMPWTRGPRRAASLARRNTLSAKAKLAGA